MTPFMAQDASYILEELIEGTDADEVLHKLRQSYTRYTYDILQAEAQSWDDVLKLVLGDVVDAQGQLAALRRRIIEELLPEVQLIG